VMGSRSVGKSSLVIQFVQGQFVDSYDPTIENTFNKNMKIQGQEYEVLVVDTAGQDEYSIFPTQYSVDIDGYVMVYSIDNEKSFDETLDCWSKEENMAGFSLYMLVEKTSQKGGSSHLREVGGSYREPFCSFSVGW